MLGEPINCLEDFELLKGEASLFLEASLVLEAPFWTWDYLKGLTFSLWVLDLSLVLDSTEIGFY